MILHTKPWKHQLEALEYLMPRSYGALYMDPGSGKTKVMIDLIANRGFKRVLILATKRICSQKVWESEFRKHYNKNNYKILSLYSYSSDRKVTEAKKLLNLSNKYLQIIVVNYDSVWRKPFRDYVLKAKFDCVICDESHRIKSAGSKVSRFLALLGKRTPNRFIMTGTPLAQGPLDLYGQYRFLDPQIFGTNFDDFKYRYGNYIQTNQGYPILNKKNPYKNLDELYEKMFCCAYTCSDLDLNLPPYLDILWEFDLPYKTQKYYKELRKESCLELKSGLVTPKNALVVLTRLQQLTSGYLPTDQGVVEIDNARREAFQELLESLPDEPIVVFCRFKKDIKNVKSVVRCIGRKSSEISGDRDTSEDWKTGKTNVLVVQIAAGAEGIDLTRARYGIYYTKDRRLWLYEQSRKRLHRPGQAKAVRFYHVTAKMKGGRTIDELISMDLENGQNIIDRIMAGNI